MPPVAVDHIATDLKDADMTPDLKFAIGTDNAIGQGLRAGFATGGLVRGPGLVKPRDLSERATLAKVVERRNTPFRDVQLRAKPNGTGGETLTFSGYACVTEASYEMQDWLGPFTEVVRAGAFTKTLSEGADVAFLVNHTGMTLARTKSGTLQLAEDGTGLLAEADLDPSSPHVQALRSAMERGDIDEMSFAFWVVRQQWSPDYEQRDILEVAMNKGDVSAVNYGANPHTTGATLHARELAAHLERLPADQRREVFDRLAVEFDQDAPLVLTDALSMRAWITARAEEVRAGKSLSSETMKVLAHVLDLIAAADDAVDKAQPILAELMGVPNPDSDDSGGAAESDSAAKGDSDGGATDDDPVGYSSTLNLFEARRRAIALNR